ncbi:type VI secretion system membrane subunit TssM [Pseudomonas sp. NPDC090233]|uniref:type VI secretion system membrane subunit TssM n=1 Tax=Pseudomonas sp. NPDC090233 TaxID=3364479 RepID=UPI00383B9098
MNKLWKLFNARGSLLASTFVPLMMGTVLTLMLIGIWWLGPHWIWGEYRPLARVELRAVASLVLVIVPMLCASLVLRARFRRLQFERDQAAAAEADPSLKYIQDQQWALDRQLARYLDHAGGRRALYQLPFYLVLGSRGAGKSSLVERSGQCFSLTHIDKAQAPGRQEGESAYAVDWWVSDNAVIIDPPGDFITQGGDPFARTNADDPAKPPTGTQAKLWMHLLHWLALNRKQRPLNGLVLVVDLAAILHASPEDRLALANLLRSRLQELNSELGMRLPLYVVLSKLDLLTGFDQLFGKLSDEERERVFGFALSVQTNASTETWYDQAANQYDLMIKRLQQHACDGLGDAPDQGQQDLLLSLPAQLAGLRPALLSFLQETLASDRPPTPTLMRGMYLTSVLQQGGTENAFVRQAAQPYGTPAPPAASRRQGKDVYFAQQLFQRVVYPEAGLADENQKVTHYRHRRLWIGSGVSMLVVAVAGANLHRFFNTNQANTQSVLVKSQAFSVGELDEQLDPTGRNLLMPLQQVRDAVSVFGDYRLAWPGVTDAGLYQGRAIGPRVDEAYLSLLSRRFLPALASGLVDAMEAAPPGSEQQMAPLRIFRMIEDRQHRRAPWVEAWMAREWQSAFPGEGQVQRDLMRHLQYALKYADTDLQAFHPRVAEVQQNLRTVPYPQRLYASLKHESGSVLQADLDLRQHVGPAFDVIYSNSDDTRLPPLLTAKGFNAFFGPRSQQLSDMAMVDQWALGDRQQLDNAEADRAAVAEQLNNLYSADYIASWRQALQQLSVTNFDSLDGGVEVLAHLAGPAAPLRRLLETVRENTVIPSQPASIEGDQQLATQAADIRRAFAGLNEMLEKHGERLSHYDETLTAIKAVLDHARAVQEDPQRGSAALEAVLQRFSSKGADPITALQRVASGLPDPLRQHISSVAEQMASVMMNEALQELDLRWQADVYSFFEQRLAGRYPFTAQPFDASLEDFEAFFGPEGKLQHFHTDYLDAFLRDNAPARAINYAGGSLIGREVREQLQAAADIRETFFDNRGNLNVQFSIEPLGLSRNQRTSLLELSGQQIAYTSGSRQRVSITWPNAQGERSTLTLLRSNGQMSSLESRGPWSVFRLLSRGGLNGRTPTSVDLSFTVGDGAVRYKVSAEKAYNPITQQPFKGFELPFSLIEHSNSNGLQARL